MPVAPPAPMTQDDIRAHYEQTWGDRPAADDLTYSSPLEDAVLYPAYERLLADVCPPLDGGSVLDVGCGSGRWVRFFRDRFPTARVTGIDFARASVDLLARRYGDANTGFAVADVTDPTLDLGNRRFDLINVMNVLFHIPEPEKFAAALANLARHLAPGGRVVTTEYLPRESMRTTWMLVRSRHAFEAAAAAAGLRVTHVRASCFFANDPMGLDAGDAGNRGRIEAVRAQTRQIMALPMNAESRQFFTAFLANVESAVLEFCRSRMSEADLPSQKLVVLAAA